MLRCAHVSLQLYHLCAHLIHRDADMFAAFINGIETGAGVGGDTAEDVFGGLKVAIEQLSWRSNDATKASCSYNTLESI